MSRQVLLELLFLSLSLSLSFAFAFLFIGQNEQLGHDRVIRGSLSCQVAMLNYNLTGKQQLKHSTGCTEQT